ncbi:MAG: hypothetical protein ABFD98_15835 [Syntrophobacteraceae bacterium]
MTAEHGAKPKKNGMLPFLSELPALSSAQHVDLWGTFIYKLRLHSVKKGMNARANERSRQKLRVGSSSFPAFSIAELQRRLLRAGCLWRYRSEKRGNLWIFFREASI